MLAFLSTVFPPKILSRGTTRPFEIIGAPWIDSESLSKRMNDLNLEGVYFRPVGFVPYSSKYKQETCGGVQIHVTDRNKFNSPKTGVALLYTIRDMYPGKLEYRNRMMDLLTGGDYIRQGTYSLSELFDIMEKDSRKFETIANKYRLYS